MTSRRAPRATPRLVRSSSLDPPCPHRVPARLDHHRLGRAPLQLLGVPGVLAAGIAFGSLAWLTGNLANALVGSGPWAPASFRPAGPST
ncbi:hypothetical protein ID875_26300 [Streptomyces globisporus]|uniref:Uncharacterized protein n=1 Tax=Streptomyces globisporus TaxID=1908 RepID=A0A927BMA0_STRGL|nr:hypothetical protein [Streptomyces globisporus]